MKKILLISLLMGCLTSCKETSDLGKPEQMELQKQNPKALIYKLPDSSYRYIMIDSNGTYYVEMTSQDKTKVTYKVVIKDGGK